MFGNSLEDISWKQMFESILSCQECSAFPELLESKRGIVFPNPFEHTSQLRLLLISWPPPGKPKAAKEGHFFHNIEVRDNLRTRVFSALTEKRPKFRLEPRPADQSLSRFYSLGLYLVPTIFRRIKNDAKPN